MVTQLVLTASYDDGWVRDNYLMETADTAEPADVAQQRWYGPPDPVYHHHNDHRHDRNHSHQHLHDHKHKESVEITTSHGSQSSHFNLNSKESLIGVKIGNEVITFNL